jgi:hypothetical protein
MAICEKVDCVAKSGLAGGGVLERVKYRKSKKLSPHVTLYQSVLQSPSGRKGDRALLGEKEA